MKTDFLFLNHICVLKDSASIELIPPVLTPDFAISPVRAIDEAKNNSSQGIDFKRRLLEAESEVNRARTEGRFDAELYAVLGLNANIGCLKWCIY